MNSPRVLIHSDQPEIALHVLKQTHPDLSPLVCSDYKNLEHWIESNKSEIVFTNNFLTDPFPRAALVESHSVKWIFRSGSGINHLLPWDPEKVIITNSAGVAADMMAEYALGVMLYFSLDIPGLRQDQQNHHWHYREVSPINGKTLLILGLGKTGQCMAKKAKSLEMKVIGVRARSMPTENVDQIYSTGELRAALSQADFILVCMPLLETTKGLIGDEEFSAMKQSAIFIDLSRGGVVQESALIRALDNQELRGAGIDVFETEPLPKDNPLWDYPNVVISPHCSSVYDGWEKRSAYMFAENLTRWRDGETLMNIVDPKRGY